MNSFCHIIKQQYTMREISIFSNSCQLEWRAEMLDIILKGGHNDCTSQIWFILVQCFQRRGSKCESLRHTATDARWWQKDHIARQSKNLQNCLKNKTQHIKRSSKHPFWHHRAFPSIMDFWSEKKQEFLPSLNSIGSVVSKKRVEM